MHRWPKAAEETHAQNTAWGGGKRRKKITETLTIFGYITFLRRVLRGHFVTGLLG